MAHLYARMAGVVNLRLAATAHPVPVVGSAIPARTPSSRRTRRPALPPGGISPTQSATEPTRLAGEISAH